jgi:Leucine-rich repeat (LRR) protein
LFCFPTSFVYFMSQYWLFLKISRILNPISVLQVMPISLNPSIQSLILRYNQFHTVDASFNFYPELELVDLSHNQLVSVPDRAFKAQSRLRDLRLNNNKISQLRPLTFSGLRRLESLDLRHNLVEALPADAFADLVSLELLDLGKNQLTAVPEGAFRGLARLRVLRLDDNNLEAVPSAAALADLASLAELHLNRNRLAVVGSAAFQPLGASLATLDLSANRLERLHPDSFRGLASLVSLRLQDNSLADLGANAEARQQLLRPLSNLESLLLGQNRFRAVPAGWLAGLPRLASLELNGCPELRRVDADAFAGNPSLEAVSLAANRQLISLDAAAFRGLINLRRVDLSNNGLTGLAASLLPWWQLASVQISGNPLQCDCASYFLKAVILSAVMNSSNRAEEDAASAVRVVRCWSPPELRDRDLALLDLDCSETALIHSLEDSSGPRLQVQSAAAAEFASTTVVAAVSATAVVVLLMISLLLLLRFAPCLRGSRRLRQLPVKPKDILQYGETVRAGGGTMVVAEPRYVASQLSGKAPQSGLLLQHPSQKLYSCGPPNMIRGSSGNNNGFGGTTYSVNIVSNPVHLTDNFLRHEDYFAAAALQQESANGRSQQRPPPPLAGQYYTIGRDGVADDLCLYETTREDETIEEDEDKLIRHNHHNRHHNHHHQRQRQNGREPIYYAVSSTDGDGGNDQSTTTTTLLKIDTGYQFRDPKSVL